jgi:3-methyladenine DNA glycosylase/8-oxoguanine DNA glycosylase
MAMDDDMNREKLVRIIRELLRTDDDLAFLKELKKEDLEKLVACIRDRID